MMKRKIAVTVMEPRRSFGKNCGMFESCTRDEEESASFAEVEEEEE